MRPTTANVALALFLVATLVGLGACDHTLSPTHRDATSSVLASDAAELDHADAGVSHDDGRRADAGVGTDAGVVTDSGAHFDAPMATDGSVVDAAALEDTAVLADDGALHDSSAIHDGSSLDDGGVDAGSATLPRVRVVVAAGEPHFALATTGERFVPRGSNYIRLANYSPTAQYHSTFEPGRYDAVAVEAAFRQMSHDGYNAVRVFIDAGSWARPSGINGPWDTPGLHGPYLDNVADFLRRATHQRIYVMPVMTELPYNAHYLGLTQPADANLEGWNAYFLHGPHLQAKRAYLEDFIDALVARLGPTFFASILAWSLENEVFFDAAYLPFSSTAVTVTTGDGLAYSMADAASRQQAADANLVHWANLLAAAIRAKDPQALVTAGAFTYAIVGKAGPAGLLPIPASGQNSWFPARLATWALYSTLSFLDVHVYPTGSAAAYSMTADLASSEWGSIPSTTLRMLGEFGAFQNVYASVSDAALAMRALQAQSCGHHFDGWLYWTYDCVEQAGLWTLLDSTGAINGQLAPLTRPDPCQP